MRRQPETLADQTFDVLVIGGGIQGISIFHELARSGFNTALIEADDFAAALHNPSLPCESAASHRRPSPSDLSRHCSARPGAPRSG